MNFLSTFKRALPFEMKFNDAGSGNVKKIVIQFNLTDLERWLWLVVIHFNPLHFHFRWSFVCLLIISYYRGGSLRARKFKLSGSLMAYDTQKCAHIHMQNFTICVHNLFCTITRPLFCELRCCWFNNIYPTNFVVHLKEIIASWRYQSLFIPLALIIFYR